MSRTGSTAEIVTKPIFSISKELKNFFRRSAQTELRAVTPSSPRRAAELTLFPLFMGKPFQCSHVDRTVTGNAETHYGLAPKYLIIIRGPSRDDLNRKLGITNWATIIYRFQGDSSNLHVYYHLSYWSTTILVRVLHTLKCYSMFIKA